MRCCLLALLMFLTTAPALAAPARRPVCLLTDHGAGGFYVGALKAAVLQKNPEAAIHDFTHELPAFDIPSSAFIVHQATAFLPTGSVVVVVVDPTVGTLRRNIAIKTRRGLTYVGPDNGVFTWVLREQGLVEAREITHPGVKLDIARSTTFHGRDIYAPAAGWLSAGHDVSELGNVIKDPVQFTVAAAELKEAAAVGQVLLVDHFGNVLTNIPRALMDKVAQPDPADAQRKVVQARFANGQTAMFPLLPTYATVKEGTEVAVVNSLGMLELALNQGSAAQKYSVRGGERVELLIRR
ncbi:MAG: SAM-dependent chlorinase/fluorinase [Deltaproteobacteria bacterium]|nr:SAM-dependent chlorinase/fluorinase [Deltaproteobacteria bacterium]